MYLEIQNAIYGLPHAGILANKQVREKLEPTRYYEVTYTSGLWRHVTQPVQYMLVINDFGVKYVNAAGYEVAIYWEGELYCGITLKLD